MLSYCRNKKTLIMYVLLSLSFKLMELTPYTNVLVVGLHWASPSAALDKNDCYLIFKEES
jgi:hypothetical protein